MIKLKSHFNYLHLNLTIFTFHSKYDKTTMVNVNVIDITLTRHCERYFLTNLYVILITNNSHGCLVTQITQNICRI